ncbi:MAG: helix-turn-helix domain-containing protein [Bacteroidetes bacterium]|nr:helix-turn-helix domain-containing protein [Bacteroidota bacterium]
MADTESKLEAGRRLARDLRSIRRSRSIDMKEVLDATRLAEDVIEQLEDTALLGNPMFNRVYLRSMFGSYAAVLGISNDDMVGALEEALSGQYVGSLAKKYLGGKSLEEGNIVATAKVPDKEVELKEDSADQNTPGLKTNLPDSTSEEPVENPSSEKSKSKRDKSKAANAKADSSQSGDQSESTSLGQPHPKEEETPSNEPRRMQIKRSPEPSMPKTSTGKSKSTVLLPNMSGFLMLVVAGLVLIALIWFAISWILSPQTPISDVLEKKEEPIQSTILRPERIVLPEKIKIELIAHVEALDPIRVQIDRDLRRPYWIENQDTLIFEMRERVEFERELNNTRILISGFAIPSDWYASTIRAEITRDRTQAWLDSLFQTGSFPPRTFGVE